MRGEGGRRNAARELEGPKETTRESPRRWPKEKERAKWKRDGGEQRVADGMGRRGNEVKGVRQHWGLLIKVGLVDPLMKVQARGLLSPLFYPDGSEGGGGGVRTPGGARKGQTATKVGKRVCEGVGPVCGPRSTDSSWSYAPDGQGRYTTPMYFRGVSL